MRVTRTSERISDQVPSTIARPAWPNSRDSQLPTPLADAAEAGARRGGSAAREIAARLGRRQQRQLVDQANRLVEPDRERGDVGDARRLDAVEVARDGAPHRLQTRLVGAREALVDLLQRGDDRLGAAGERGLLQAGAQGRFAVGDEVLVARARDRLHQRLELAALDGDFVEARLEQRDLGGGIARALLRLAREQRRFGDLERAVLLALDELALAAADALVGTPGEAEGDDREQREQQDRERQAARHARPRRFGGVDRCGRCRRGSDGREGEIARRGGRRRIVVHGCDRL